ncbi:SAM-dependent methyltransferase [Mycolicibacterium vaccae]|uniref:SAM-dependent methyltransferase n=1 Tax=Mycolicibacterium vaccae TaxID=1810 RepID=UPI003CE93696
MTDADRTRWDRRYAAGGPGLPGQAALPDPFGDFADVFPSAGTALDIACGRGGAAVWLARRGMTVHGFDVSPVAVAQARKLATEAGCSARCHFEVVDLDAGLPPGPPAEVIVCSRYRDARLYAPLRDRLVPGGLLAVSALSEVGAAPGPYRAAPGELVRAFGSLDVVASGERDGLAWLLARRPSLGRIRSWPTPR